MFHDDGNPSWKWVRTTRRAKSSEPGPSTPVPSTPGEHAAGDGLGRGARTHHLHPCSSWHPQSLDRA